mgnify:CR=1 FL=1
MVFEKIGDGLQNTINHVYAFLSGVIASILGYFLPVKNIVHVIIAFFILDVIFGFFKARKLRKEKFSCKIVWKTTMPRMIISLILVCLAFVWDKEFGQTYVETYNIVGWFITGVLFLSIIQSCYLITNWEMFPLLGKLVKNKITEKANVDIDEMKEEKKDKTKEQ